MEEKTSTVKSENKKRERSAAYPAFELEQMVCDIANLTQKLGKGPFSRDSAAKALGYSGISGVSSSRIAACVHFGLLERTGGAYCLSELAQKIVYSENDAEKKRAIIDAVQSPALYSKLLSEFNGQALPQMLDNILVRRYGISNNAANNAAKIFRASIEYAGVLENGIVSLNRAESDAAKADVLDDDQREATGTESPISLGGTAAQLAIQGKEERIRGINERGDNWSVEVCIRYNIDLPRDLRKEINAFLDSADDIIDGLTKLQGNDDAHEKETV